MVLFISTAVKVYAYCKATGTGSLLEFAVGCEHTNYVCSVLMFFLVICYTILEKGYCTEWTFVLTQSSHSYVLNIDAIVFLILSVANFISGAGDQPAWQNRARTTLQDGKFT